MKLMALLLDFMSVSFLSSTAAAAAAPLKWDFSSGCRPRRDGDLWIRDPNEGGSRSEYVRRQRVVDDDDVAVIA